MIANRSRVGVVEVCTSCGASNRIPFSRLHQAAKCGRCQTAVRTAGSLVEVSTAQLDVLIAESAVPVVVDFWAPWCGPCRVLAPQLDQVAQRMAGQIVVARLNVDDHPDAAARFGARAIPLLLMFDRGRTVWRQTGATSAPALERSIREKLPTPPAAARSHSAA